MNKEKCQVIAWSNISTETLILLYCNEFICDCRHKEILESFSVVGEYEISFEYLGITVNVSSMYQDELDECDDLTEDNADYIIDMNGLRFFIFNI